MSKRSMLLWFLMLFTVCLWGQTRNSKLAVMEIGDKTGKMTPDILDNAAEYLRSKLVSSGRFVVISKERQMAVKIKELKRESYKECYDQKCQIPLGQALAADTILSTTITKMSGVYVVTAELIDLSKEATIFGATAQFDGLEEGLRRALDSIAEQLQNARPVMTAVKAVVYAVKFEANAPGAKAYLDGRLFCFNLPCEKDVEEGEHEIRITAPGYVAEEIKTLVDKSRVFSAKMLKDEAYLAITNSDLGGDMTIRLDGAVIKTLPMPKRQMAPGKHTLVVESACYEKLDGVIELKPEEEKEIKIGLTPKKVPLSVEVTDSGGAKIEGAQVWVDGVAVGTAPGPFFVPLCSKELVVRKGGYVDFWLPLAFKEGEPFNAVAMLDYQYTTVHPYKWWGTGLLIGGAAVLGVGIAFDVLADKEYRDYRTMSMPAALEEAMKEPDFTRASYDAKMKTVYDRAKTYDIIRIVGYSVGGAMAVTGVVLLAIPEDVKVLDLEGFAVSPYRDGVMLSFGYEF